MNFNFKLFSVLAERAYVNVRVRYEVNYGAPVCLYPLENALSVFKYYFQKYEDTFDRAHPNIRMEQIERIIILMPGIDGNGAIDIDADDYPTLIDKHFKTQYRSCDYNINHFFSGDIRLMRFYEEFY